MVRSESEEKERTRDKRYRKAYRITLDTYNKIGDAQGWRCGEFIMVLTGCIKPSYNKSRLSV